jgi:hypothetical protein
LSRSPAGGRRLGGEAVEHLGEWGHGSPELQHLAGELVDALGRPGPGGGEDRLLDLLDGVVEGAEDGAVAFGGVVDHAGEHRRRPGAGQLRVVLHVLAEVLQHGPVAVDADHEAVAEHQLHLPEPDRLLGGHPGGRLDHRQEQLAGELQHRSWCRRRQAVDQRSRQAEFALDGCQLLGAGVAQADPDEPVRGRLGAAALPVLVGRSRAGHHASPVPTGDALLRFGTGPTIEQA